jgi:hypothetical protein
VGGSSAIAGFGDSLARTEIAEIRVQDMPKIAVRRSINEF